MLREVSFILQRTLADTVSLACRYGGDEFTVILLDADLDAGDRRSPRRSGRPIDDWTFLPMSIGPGEPALNLKNVITMSVGVASYRAHCTPCLPAAEQKNELLKKADSALYAAKTKGKNCVVAAEAAPLGADGALASS